MLKHMSERNSVLIQRSDEPMVNLGHRDLASVQFVE